MAKAKSKLSATKASKAQIAAQQKKSNARAINMTVLVILAIETVLLLAVQIVYSLRLIDSIICNCISGGIKMIFFPMAICAAIACMRLRQSNSSEKITVNSLCSCGGIANAFVIVFLVYAAKYVINIFMSQLAGLVSDKVNSMAGLLLGAVVFVLLWAAALKFYPAALYAAKGCSVKESLRQSMHRTDFSYFSLLVKKGIIPLLIFAGIIIISSIISAIIAFMNGNNTFLNIVKPIVSFIGICVAWCIYNGAANLIASVDELLTVSKIEK